MVHQTTQYFVDPPLTVMTFFTRDDIEFARDAKYSSDNAFHSLCRTENNSSQLVGCFKRVRRRCFSKPQTFSIGFISGLCAGHFMRVTPFACRYFAMLLALCGPQLSSCRIKSSDPPCVAFMKGSKFASKISLYLCWLNRPSIRTSEDRPRTENAPIR